MLSNPFGWRERLRVRDDEFEPDYAIMVILLHLQLSITFAISFELVSMIQMTMMFGVLLTMLGTLWYAIRLEPEVRWAWLRLDIYCASALLFLNAMYLGAFGLRTPSAATADMGYRILGALWAAALAIAILTMIPHGVWALRERARGQKDEEDIINEVLEGEN